MAISLNKGGNISLSKEAPGLTQVRVGLGWDARATDGAPFDLDASAFLLSAAGRVRSDADFIFYNQLVSIDGSVRHTGDERNGATAGDDESIELDLTKIPTDVAKVVFCVTIHDAERHRLNFGMVNNAYVRVINGANDVEVARFDLGEDASIETAIIFGEVYRHGTDWKFRAVGQGYQGGLGPLARNFGVQV
jgi:tellurium resistance protein TerD